MQLVPDILSHELAEQAVLLASLELGEGLKVVNVLEMTSAASLISLSLNCLFFFNFNRLDILRRLLLDWLGLLFFSNLDGRDNIVVLGNGFEELLALIKLKGFHWGLLLLNSGLLLLLGVVWGVRILGGGYIFSHRFLGGSSL